MMSMTTELIDRLRQHADLLKEMGFDPDGMVMNDYKEAADTIQLLSEKLHASQIERSSQYYNDGWIPVSERLPEENGEYLVTRKRPWHEYVDIVAKGDCNGNVIASDIVAWMPSPKPYQTKEGEK